ncbi:hypothetical protein H1230_06835 [Paenibacillus sp. 19GGS1-52]|uniref:hypothetical protein n=1 Tax=Paenibacillus sp. 19GGS1-52 TaxID=2758563 RepID=UPI001EFAAF99|nr:hypothetical protein [Paenibacillus sp. 19GGS1-52]ULO08517.1 hypothetical protein H1230_06835 [Paenibacillus sp. 19GGS1-52]
MTDFHVNLNFLEPWEEDNNLFFVNELENEVVDDHELSGIRLKTIARRMDQDDFLFQLIEEPNKYVEVHLTWTKESSKNYPRYKFFSTFQEWINNRMIPDNFEYKD